MPASDALLLRAARRAPTPYTPIWLMRQAGRYLPEYRAMRERYGFLELARNPEAAAEVTLQPVDRLVHRPVRSEAQVARLGAIDVDAAVPFVFEAVRRVKQALGGKVPLIGFAGAPFTVASYVVEGGPSRDYLHTKRLMYEEPEGWARLMGILVAATARYLNAQIAAGAEAVQIFDSWVGVLAPDDYRAFVMPHTQALIRALTPGTPVIHFGTGTASLLPHMRAAGGDVIGLDWRVDLDTAWAMVGHDVAVQGNLDPAVLLTKPAHIRRRVKDILGRAGGRPGHIFNLGHGVLPQTPVEHVKALVEMVHEMSARR
ncbi:MAG: uroporphyrinogen decarboxylase [Candidatus Rokuibacteriota bacterium]|nr:MAG: uroporphyrinogen decarboxylase [Candidatus Rokubacteria bacterium]